MSKRKFEVKVSRTMKYEVDIDDEKLEDGLIEDFETISAQQLGIDNIGELNDARYRKNQKMPNKLLLMSATTFSYSWNYINRIY